jgi:hypothetical protein
MLGWSFTPHPGHRRRTRHDQRIDPALPTGGEQLAGLGERVALGALALAAAVGVGCWLALELEAVLFAGGPIHLSPTTALAGLARVPAHLADSRDA